MSAAGTAGIRCPIDLFAVQEIKIEAYTHAINSAQTAAEKAPPAHALVEAANLLVACEHFDPMNLNCRLCRSFSGLRARIGRVIVDIGDSGMWPAYESEKPRTKSL